MVIAPPRQPRARRRRPERRACPTPCVRALRWRGRRHGFRRAGEGYQTSVDGLAWRIVGRALLVFVRALLEALWTLRPLDQGGQEAHPLRAMALTYGPPRLPPAEDRPHQGGAAGGWQPSTRVRWRSVACTG